ncbi:pilin [Agarivorans gilvus]|uniref:Type IV-A pilin protein PilA n=1 Tax=Agarivorans gilvus TaxID=680279 RepID=A0ABQ1HYB4_9ALTE|nr:prepilin-type N-terminal cleavage/methylation domain-containing protein [Agarivorans gilvus]GGA96689.1 type IV-A pilin protein PilA [Agarivorans gilvus]
MKTIQNLQTKAANKQAGFTLIELMIVVAIVAILAAVALPAYNEYVKKSKFASVATAVQGYKVKVELCHAMEGGFDECDANSHDIPANIATGTDTNGLVDTVEVENGVITGTATAAADSHTIILTPSVENNRVIWEVTGSCIGANLCKGNE